MNYRLLLLLVVSVLIYYANLGGTSIYILDEAKNAGCAMEMAQRNDWVVPTFNDQLRTDKPALHYFFMIAAYQVFGVTPFAARLFSALGGVLLILFLYVHVKKIIDEGTAFFSCLVLLSSIQLAVQFHLAVPDPYLILLLTICLVFVYKGLCHSDQSIYWMYVAAALAFMTKGLIAVVFPAIIAFAFLIFTRQLNWKSILRLRLGYGIILFSVIALPWYIAVGHATNGAWLHGFFIEHNLDRYTSTMEGHRGFLLAPFAILIGALLPFSVFSIQAVALAIRKRSEYPFLLFCLLAVVSIGGFFTFSKTILPSYPAPALPFLAVLLGYYINQFTQQQPTQRLHFSFAFNLLLCVAVPVAIYFALHHEKELSTLRHFAWLFMVLPLGSITGWYLFIKKRNTDFVYAWSGSWILAIVLFFYVAYPQVDRKNPVAESMPLITSTYADYTMVVYKQFNPAYVFRLRKTMKVIDSPEELATVLANTNNVLLFTRTKYAEELQSIPSLKVIYQGRDLFEGSETLLLAN
ncbi:MAG: hypothetical protein C0523_05975 [Cytophaga sp.]|nr:hypothetical protein [Cytophaga sp.]